MVKIKASIVHLRKLKKKRGIIAKKTSAFYFNFFCCKNFSKSCPSIQKPPN